MNTHTAEYRDFSEPAFPSYKPNENREGFDSKYLQSRFNEGMTLRDYFAGQAIMGLAKDAEIDRVSRWAYDLADLMLEARKK